MYVWIRRTRGDAMHKVSLSVQRTLGPRPKRWRWWVVLGCLSIVYIIGHLPFHVSNGLQQEQSPAKTSAHNSISNPASQSPWTKPLRVKGTIIQFFGWHREHGSMVFSSGIQIHVPKPANVFAPVRGQVSSLTRHGFILNLSDTQVEFEGLSRIFVHRNQKLTRNQIVGQTSNDLTIVVRRGSFPVNPLAVQYFGRRWLHL